jgi:hypothetical protein
MVLRKVEQIGNVPDYSSSGNNTCNATPFTSPFTVGFGGRATASEAQLLNGLPDCGASWH